MFSVLGVHIGQTYNLGVIGAIVGTGFGGLIYFQFVVAIIRKNIEMF